ncbi:hypothetical protein VTN96DRAFT_1875 [Rasamsonia emersonii]
MSDNQQPQQQGGNPPSDNNSNNNNQQEDYLDKGLDALERKFGHGKIDPAKMRDTNEKITDAVREGFEQWTGKHVPKELSN